MPAISTSRSGKAVASAVTARKTVLAYAHSDAATFPATWTIGMMSRMRAPST
jgi:hypothetical protein